MKLYYSPGACSLASHILLRETGAEFALERVDTARHATEAGADYYPINPKGQVPLLELADGQRLSEGPVIGQYLSERAGAQSLLPREGLARYRVLEWQNYVATELHKSFSPLFNPAMPDEAKNIFREKIGKTFGHINDRLAGRDYLMGSQFTVADGYLFTMLRWALGLKFDLAQHPNVKAYFDRVGARPKVKEAMLAEGLIKAA